MERRKSSGLRRAALIRKKGGDSHNQPDRQ
jgi:hypothetical protein